MSKIKRFKLEQSTTETYTSRGHYHRLEVLPLSKAAIDLFDTEDDSHHGWIPDYLLKPAEKEDLIRMYNQ